MSGEDKVTGLLEGVKVADFTWVVVGPRTCQYLAEHGATVIRIESMAHPDQLRTGGPFKDGKPGVNRTAYFARYNTNKYSAALNLSHPKAREIARRFIQWADIVVESYRPGIMEKWGLGYSELRKVKPSIIMLSASAFGQSGPHAKERIFGTELASVAGLTELTGWSDRPPAGLFGAYTDFIVPHFNVALLVAALIRQRRTGKGLYVDVSEFECALQFLAPAILDWAANSREWERQGNHSPYACPHGAYECQGQDRWCTISVSTDEEWQSFCRVVGKPEWLTDPEFSTGLGRKNNEQKLDLLVESWTKNLAAEEVMKRMQEAGVPAGIVETPEDIYSDPQLAYRQHFKVLDHPEIGSFPFEGPAFILSKTPAKVTMPAPCLGEHSYYVYTQLLGMTDKEFVQLVADGVIE